MCPVAQTPPQTNSQALRPSKGVSPPLVRWETLFQAVLWVGNVILQEWRLS